MKTLITNILMLSCTIGVFGQPSASTRTNLTDSPTISYIDWSNPIVFNTSKSPRVKGYGYFSDSLSNVFNGVAFYEYNNDYYPIESWADYYYWFTKKYSHLFSDPQVYEYYYITGDDFGMASYITSSKYLGKYYPSSFVVNFEDKVVAENRLTSKQYIIDSPKKERVLNKQLLINNNKNVDLNTSHSNHRNRPGVIDKEVIRSQQIDVVNSTSNSSETILIK